MDESAAYTWVPPEFNLSRPPPSPQLWPSFSDPGNFARSAKWCPDGSVALVQCENREFRIISPSTSELQDGTTSKISYASNVSAHFQGFNSTLNDSRLLTTLPQSGPILDYAWYPTASSATPASFCFVASVREGPVKLLDASDGRLRASYPIVDHRERQIAPHSLVFNLSATKLYCGFEDAIEVFDVGSPGAGKATRIHTSPSKKSRDGLKGIISALAFSPSYETDMYAAGSLTATPGNIALFTETDSAVPVSFINGGPAAGVTQLHFNPMRPHILYAAFRRHRAVYSWDLRADVGAPLAIYSPIDTHSANAGDLSEPNQNAQGETNQKRRFDVDSAGRFMGVGDQHGNVNIFDLSAEDGDEAENSPAVAPLLRWRAHQDAIGAVSFHPTRAALLSNSGSRHFPADVEGDSDSSEASDDEEEENGGAGVARVVQRSTVRLEPVALDSSMKLWDLGTDAAYLA
ncbi:WD40-repeat-containing domain protein [Mycena galopus ATCC 62051]|nr:WD40-repeat-containing domain protein [Mycena galopus ATCC 62051]